MIKGRYRITGRDKSGIIVADTGWVKNLVVLNDEHGLNLIIRNLAGGSYAADHHLSILKAKMGTGTTPPADADEDLETPTVDDILIATVNVTNPDEVAFKFFASDSDVPDDTYTEFGIFAGDDTKPTLQAYLDAALLFARSIITPSYVKAAGVDTTIEYILTGYNTIGS